MGSLRIVYDGDCPFCSRYVRLVRLRENFIVELIDARQHPDLAHSYGLDLNEGMIADLDGRVHHGAEAVWLPATLSAKSGFANRLMATLFSTRPLAKIAYPAMRCGRNLTLSFLGRKRLNTPSARSE
jgi:predicted DCC family thiol-disulfide oxidoreductase YuxK